MRENLLIGAKWAMWNYFPKYRNGGRNQDMDFYSLIYSGQIFSNPGRWASPVFCLCRLAVAPGAPRRPVADPVSAILARCARAP